MSNDSKYVRLYPERAVAPARKVLEELLTEFEADSLHLDDVKSALADLDRLGFPPDEPLFLLRGQDKNAPDTVRFYFDCLEAMGGDFDLEHAEEHVAAMAAWQPRKMPD